MSKRENCIKCEAPISDEQHRLWIKIKLKQGKSPIGWPKVCSVCVLKSIMTMDDVPAPRKRKKRSKK